MPLYRHVQDQFADPVPVVNGGTGATTTAVARTNLGAVGKYVEVIGDGVASVFTITHGLGTADVVVQVRLSGVIYGVFIEPEIAVKGANTVRIDFGYVPSVGLYTVIVMG